MHPHFHSFSCSAFDCVLSSQLKLNCQCLQKYLKLSCKHPEMCLQITITQSQILVWLVPKKLRMSCHQNLLFQNYNKVYLKHISSAKAWTLSSMDTLTSASADPLLASAVLSNLLGLSPGGRRVGRLLLASLQYRKFHSNGDNSLRWNGTVGSRSARKNAPVSACLFTGPPCVPLPVRQALPAHYGVMKSCPPARPSWTPAGKSVAVPRWQSPAAGKNKREK